MPLLQNLPSNKRATAKASAGKHASPFKLNHGDTGMEASVAATNPNYSAGRSEYRRNCQRCVAAYEARRRGYDVVAKPRDMSGSDKLPYMNDPEGWPQVFENPDLRKCASNTGLGTRAKVEAEMASWGDGARAIVRVQWRGKRAGHVFIAEQVNGTTRFIDPQTGSLDCSAYFASVKKNATYCMRIDDRGFTDLIGKCCEDA